MLSMVNANRFIRAGAIPLVLVGYAVFIWIDHARATRGYEDPDVKVHMQNVKTRRSVDALVFGGSNAIYSLSAGYLSYNTGLNWYNASLDGELGTIDRYKSFVLELSARIERTKVKYVVYSSAFPYLIGLIDYQVRRELNGIGIKPSGSVLGYIVQYLSGRLRQVSSRSQQNSLGDIVFERQRNSFGDIVFESVKCAFTKIPGHQREDEDVAVDFLVDKAIFFTSVFPNASILIVLPSEYYGVASFDDSIFEKDLRSKIYSLLRAKYHFGGMVKIIFQPPYSSITQVCDNESHANEDGRVWRTGNLIESIRAKNLFASD
jgi:hypothetical protein